ncbi:MAG: RHS repeat-associated core domain-containing protein [Ardenticatenaceae bacterium]|nr:RHS repeat-associated core domain-containing protein [Ardenticatenaceae bacterium]MCB9003550.1 RHS repeat-associated core domain-containing protein [Ardenticatenaceae bacterium]
MTDAAGNPVGDIVRYYPFGDYRAAPTARQSAISDRGFTGHKSGENGGSNDLGLIYMNARYFVVGIARFASADTLVPDPANPQSFNRYSYVRNNPLNFRDPSGHCATRGSSTEADECWDYLENEDGFCNDLDCGDIGWQRWVDVFGSSEHWNKSELELLRTALLAVKGTLQELGFANWTAEVGQYRFIRSEDVRGPWTDSDSFKINLTTRLVFGERPMDAIFGIIHEIGHVFDPGGEIGLGQSVLENVGAKRSFFGLGSLVSDGFCFRSHSCNSRSEFWADSFALYAINRSHSVFVENLGSTLPGGYILITGPLATARTYQDVEDAYLNGNYVKLLEAVQVTLTSR